MEKGYERMQINVIEQQTKIYIYGAGRVGRLMENLLVKSGYSIVAFLDINATSRRYKNYNIIAPQELDKVKDATDVMIIIALAAENIAKSVKESLEIAGYQDVYLYSDRRIQEQFCLRNKGIECMQCAFVSFCNLENKNTPKYTKIHIADLAINLTTKCSLNCKNCVALTPKLKEKKIVRDLNVNDFENALKVLELYIDTINEYVLSGGDPLLNKNISGIIEVILKSTINFKRIRIVTPGIIPIPKELIAYLKNEKIIITIDNYGNKLKERESLTLQRNIESFDKNDCNYELLDNADGLWYDFGGFEDRKLSETEVAKRFEGCIMRNCIVLTPTCYLGRCGRHMVYVSSFGEIPKQENKEYIDLLNDGEMVESKLVEMLEMKTLQACNYCNGMDNVVSAGEQV